MTATHEVKTMPGAWPLVGHFPAYARDPLGFVTDAVWANGGLARIRFGPQPGLLVAEPAAVEEVLVGHHRDFVKGRANAKVGVVVGQGILLSEGEPWRRHRRIVQPAFQHDRVTGWADVMVEEIEALVLRWQDGDERDVLADMSGLAMAIVGRTLLDSAIAPAEIDIVREAAATLTDHFDSRFNTLAFFIPDRLPTPGNRRMRRAVRRVDAIVYRLIAERRDSGQRGGDVISMLLDARDESGQGLSDLEIRDEVMTLFMAGHETTAVALTWALDQLARAPEAQAALATEVAAVLDGRAPGVADLHRLRYTEACVFETLRLYPPAYGLSREVATPTSVGGCPLPRRSIAVVSLWAAHRDPQAFDEAESFRPGRWLDGLARRLPRGRYLPFAEGPRKCIGAGFAMQEMTLALATIIGRWQLHPADDRPVPLRPAITLRPAGPVRVRIARRADRVGET